MCIFNVFFTLAGKTKKNFSSKIKIYICNKRRWIRRRERKQVKSFCRSLRSKKFIFSCEFFSLKSFNVVHLLTSACDKLLYNFFCWCYRLMWIWNWGLGMEIYRSYGNFSRWFLKFVKKKCRNLVIMLKFRKGCRIKSQNIRILIEI